MARTVERAQRRGPPPRARPLHAPPAPRRSARLNPAKAASTRAKAEDTNRVTKAKTKAKTERYDCTTCDRTLAASAFPDYLTTDNCEHMINTCKSCLKQFITMQLASTTHDKIACPECPQILQNSDMKIHATKIDYKRFDELERKSVAESTPGWRWCLAPKCKAGQVHEPLLKVDNIAKQSNVEVAKSSRMFGPIFSRSSKRASNTLQRKAEKKTIDEDSICTCKECGAKACVRCDRPYHESETCEEYQGRRKAEEEASEKLIKKACKQCPSCSWNIERISGCDHMHCSKCGTNFCWICLTNYKDVNTKGHAKGCTYALPGRIDPHAVNAQALVNGAGAGDHFNFAGLFAVGMGGMGGIWGVNPNDAADAAAGAVAGGNVR